MNDMKDLQERLDQLEIRHSFQEETLQTLSQELFSLRCRVDSMERLNKEMSRRLKELGENAGPDTFPADQKPPHY